MAAILEQCKISPTSSSPRELSLPLLFFDMLTIDLPANRGVLFYALPCLKSHFLEAIVPKLKRSLSQTLTHFLPLAGNIIHSLNSCDPAVLHYVAGDAVSFTVSESIADFSYLSGYHPRVANELHAFAPLNLLRKTRSEHSVACPLLALQVTFFPGQGVCIGFEVHHVVADGSSFLSFMRAWALIYRNMHTVDDDMIRSTLSEAKCLPFYDRKTVININGLDSIYWDSIVKRSISVEPPPLKLSIPKVRTSLVLAKEEIEKLKMYLQAKQTGTNIHHLSSFTVACALVWICSAKSAAAGGEDVRDEEVEYFTFMADCRERLKPPLPSNYFGNCVIPIKAELKHGVLKGDNGFVLAAESIGKAIRDKVYGESGILHGAERWNEEFDELLLENRRVYGVAGAPRFDFYGVDYGWGKAKKFEILSIDGNNGSISMTKSRDLEGGLEIGLSKPKLPMEAFTSVFKKLVTDFLGSSLVTSR